MSTCTILGKATYFWTLTGLKGTEKFNLSPSAKSLWLEETDKSCELLLESSFERPILFQIMVLLK